MVKLPGWPVEKPAIKLPAGFFLREDEDFLYLLHGEEEVAKFSATGVKPDWVEAVAGGHHDSHKKG